jgi:hypothetical protein
MRDGNKPRMILMIVHSSSQTRAFQFASSKPFSMTSLSLPTALCLLVFLFISNASAFQLSPASHSISSQQATSSSLNLFGKKKQEPPAKPVEEKKKEPFIFVYGKPQYDWGKRRPMTLKEMNQQTKNTPFNWNISSKNKGN